MTEDKKSHISLVGIMHGIKKYSKSSHDFSGILGCLINGIMITKLWSKNPTMIPSPQLIHPWKTKGFRGFKVGSSIRMCFFSW